jgi:uncharacterized protein (TIGR00255 family)
VGSRVPTHDGRHEAPQGSVALEVSCSARWVVPMRSMTGFGIGYATFGAGRLCLEVKSLNHRYLDVRVKVPAELGDYAFFLEHLARSRLARGRFDIQLRAEGQTSPPPRLDVDRVRSLYRQLSALRDELTPTTDIPLSALLSLPSMYIESDECQADRARRAIEEAFNDAKTRLEEMRAREGAQLAKALSELLTRATKFLAQCTERARESVQMHRNRLRERIARLADDPNIVVEPARLEQEVALIADRSDVTEELARLESHFTQFRQLIATEEPSGRRMDFLLQEIGRETNTLGAKSQDAILSHLVVELKAESERMREQVQNVE